MNRLLVVSVILVFICLLSGVLLISTTPERLRFGFSQEPPYAYLNESGALMGVFVDAAEQISGELEVEQIEWVQQDFFQLFAALHQKRIDVIAAGITIIPERAESMCFTEPLLQASSALLVLSASDVNTNSFAVDETVAVIANSIEHQTLAREGRSLLLVSSADEGAIAVLQHKATALVMTEPALIELQKQFKSQFKLVKHSNVIDFEHFSAFAVRHSEVALVKLWNTAQRNLQSQPGFKGAVKSFGFNIPTLSSSIADDCYAF